MIYLISAIVLLAVLAVWCCLIMAGRCNNINTDEWGEP